LGAVASLVIMFAALGVRTNLSEPGTLVFLGLKILFTGGVVVLSSVCLAKLARPGGEHRTILLPVGVPFVAIMLLAAFSLARASRSHWDIMIGGEQWLECLISIPAIAVVPFGIVIWAVRQAAPTDLKRAGILAGLVAGGVSALGYALHCTDDSLPFVALWYGGTIALCALAGATLGSRLLRW
jgi:hypothetical protein